MQKQSITSLVKIIDQKTYEIIGARLFITLDKNITPIDLPLQTNCNTIPNSVVYQKNGNKASISINWEKFDILPLTAKYNSYALNKESTQGNLFAYLDKDANILKAYFHEDGEINSICEMVADQILKY